MGVGLNSDGIYLVKITASGNVIWSKTYRNTSSHANAVQQTADGGFLIAGVTDDNADNGNLYLVKTDANGNSGCYETNPFTNVVNPIIHINKPQTIASSRNINVHVLPIIRGSGTNVTTLCSSLGIEEFSGHNEINIYPNPSSNGIFQIRNTINGVIEKTEVSNYLGQIIFSKKGNIEEINLSNFSHGIYFYSVNKGEGKIFNGKIIKQ
jgi:hypothetical protein